MGNAQSELLTMFNSYLNDLTIHKAEAGIHTLGNSNFEGLLPRQAVEQMINMTRAQDGWVRDTDYKLRNQMAGTVPIVKINSPVSQGVGMDGSGEQITKRANLTRASYSCKKYRSDWVITWDDLREAKAAGIENFNANLRSSFFTAIGNDIAHVIMRSDTSRGSVTEWDKLLNQVNGVSKSLDSSNVTDAAGKAFGPGMFAAMFDKMPSEYASDPNLKFWFNSKMNIAWKNSLTNVATTEKMRSAVGDAALTSKQEFSPLGIPPLIVPQILSNQGPVALNPTSIADDGDGTMTLVLTTLVTAGYVASAATGAGRKFIVTHLPTGKYEILTGVLDTTLKIYTTTSLGQTTISTTTTDYKVTLADETEALLINPKAITVVYCEEIRVMTEYSKDNDWFETTAYYYLDVLVPTPEVGVKFKRVQLPDITTW